MSNLIIHNGLADRLREAAQINHQSVEELLTELLDQINKSVQQDPPSNLALAVEKYAMPLGGDTDISERSREILDTEWAQDLEDRIASASDE
jgi:hypothetical protein